MLGVYCFDYKSMNTMQFTCFFPLLEVWLLRNENVQLWLGGASSADEALAEEA